MMRIMLSTLFKQRRCLFGHRSVENGRKEAYIVIFVSKYYIKMEGCKQPSLERYQHFG